MKCPNCEYKYGYVWDEDILDHKYYDSEKGGFYQLPQHMKKRSKGNITRMPVYGCPSCRIVFMVE